jgi:hypothetical protein
VNREIGPATTLLSFNQARVGEYLQMVAHGRLRKPEWPSEVADARFAVGMSADQAEQSEACGVGEHAKGGGELVRGLLSEGLGEHLRAAGCIDRLNQLHENILTAIDVSVNVSTAINTPAAERRIRR